MAYLTEEQAMEVATYAMEPFIEGNIKGSTPIKSLLRELDESDGMELESIRTSIVAKAAAFGSTVTIGYGTLLKCGRIQTLADEIYAVGY